MECDVGRSASRLCRRAASSRQFHAERGTRTEQPSQEGNAQLICRIVCVSPVRKAIEIDSKYDYSYIGLGNVAYKQGNIAEAQQYYRTAYTLSEKTYQENRADLDGKMRFARRSLYVEQAEQALTLAADVIKNQLSSPEDRLAMRFVMVTSLFYQQKRIDAFKELQALLDDYRSLTQYDEDEYGYETTKNIISMSQKLTETDKTLLLALIDMLEAPKAEGDKKLQELKARLPGLLPQ